MNAVTPANERAIIGGNSPPEPTPFELVEADATARYEEAKLWLDGAAVDSQGVADGLSKLINLLRAAEKAADALRVVEKKPHDEAGAAVQAKFKPITDKCKRAIDGCKKALTPWLEKVEAAKRATEAAAKKAAEEAIRAAQEALRTSDPPVMTDPVVAARHFWGTKPAEMKAFIQSLAEDEVREAGKAAEFISIPGFIINSESKAV